MDIVQRELKVLEKKIVHAKQEKNSKKNSEEEHWLQTFIVLKTNLVRAWRKKNVKVVYSDKEAT